MRRPAAWLTALLVAGCGAAPGLPSTPFMAGRDPALATIEGTP